jgi:hypothetical protein
VTAGALFAAGWSLFIDACLMHGKLSFLHWLGGVLATLSALFLNLVSRHDLAGSADFYGDGGQKRIRAYLLCVYVISFAALAVSVGVLVHDGKDDGNDLWPGIATVLQTTLILASGMVFFNTQNTEADNDGFLM